MPSEFPQFLKHKSLESLRTEFNTRLQAILYKPLTIENIEVFADEALSEAAKLSEDVLEEYRSNPNIKASPTTLSTQEQEDEAFAILDLKNINGILDQINKVKEQIDSLKIYLEKNTEFIDVVINPPQEEMGPQIGSGNGGFEKKRIFPRLLTLMYILEHDFEIVPTPETVPIKEGRVTPDMMRKTPYMRVEIPELNRAVYICDEEGNVSYIFDTDKVAQAQLTLEEIDIDDKGDKNSLIGYHPGIGVSMRQSKNWVAGMSKALRETIPEKPSVIPVEHEIKEREGIYERGSEFEIKKKKPNNFWEKISIEELKQEIISRGFDPENLPGSEKLKEDNADLNRGLVRKFGSFNEARKALGGEILKMDIGYWKNLSIDEWRKEIIKRGLDPENLPSTTELKENNRDLLGGLYKRFGNLSKARRVFEGPLLQKEFGYWKNLSLDELKEEIRNRGLDPENLESKKIWEENSDLGHGLARRFGNFNDARIALGGTVLRKTKKAK